jgi:Lrp/AsnC family transcriptional regulator for asnA, asnC and gidA
MIDDLDRRIIGALQDRGRRSNSDIAREFGITESTVRRRVDRLLQERIITIAVMPDEKKLGMHHHVLLGFRCDLSQIAETLQRLKEMPNLRWVGQTMGPYQVFAEAMFPHAEMFHDFYLSTLSKVPGITEIDTITVLSHAKQTYNWSYLMDQALQAARGTGDPQAGE